MAYEIRHEIRTPKSMHKDYLNNLINTFANHWADYHANKYGWTITSVEIMKQDSRGAISVSLYNGSTVTNQHFEGDSAKELISFMSGFIHDKKWLSLDEKG